MVQKIKVKAGKGDPTRPGVHNGPYTTFIILG